MSLVYFKHEWFTHPDWWFRTCPATDAFLVQTFGHWLEADMSEYSWDGSTELLIAWVLVYDQLPRHAARVDPTYAPLVASGLKKAVALVEYGLEHNGAGLTGCAGLTGYAGLTGLTGHEFGFLMLPLRHTQKAPLVFKAMREMWHQIELAWAQSRTTFVAELKPFLVASYQRCPVPTEAELKAIGVLETWPGAGAETETEAGTGVPWEKHRDILVGLPEPLLEGEIQRPPWTTGWVPPPCVEGALVVSLSGGVDSMVLLWILRHYYPTLPVHAVFIHYCNRSDAEEAFVRDVARAYKVTLTVRRIRELQRAPAMRLEMRETYETYTRRCRLGTYRLVHPEPVVALGHNQDDGFENILSNISKRQKYDRLTGMRAVIKTDGIVFWRPLLEISKKDIYQFAYQHGIPYLQDSTPSWSRRGQIRDKVRPVLEAWSPQIVDAFFSVSQALTEYHSFLTFWVQRVVSGLPVLPFHDTPGTLWRSLEFWRHCFQSLGYHPSLKSIKHFMERLDVFYRVPTKTRVCVYLSQHHCVKLHRDVSTGLCTMNIDTSTKKNKRLV